MAQPVPPDRAQLRPEKPRGSLPEPMPVQYHVTIQKSWRVPGVPPVVRAPKSESPS